MKKTYLTLCLLIIFNFSFAQNNTFPVTGNVGIGTTSPTKKLHVIGPALFAGNYDGTNNVQFATAGGAGNTWELYPQTSGFGIFNRTSSLFSFFVSNNNKIGIGTLSPASQLHVVTPGTTTPEKLFIGQVSDAADDFVEIGNTTNAGSVFIPYLKGRVVSGNKGALFTIGEIESANDTGTDPVTMFSSRYAAGPVTNRPLFGWTNYGTRYMTMLANGNLGLGTENPTEKLSVKGKIRAQEIKVELTGWADFVFTKDYKLPTLQETENHIKEKGHLPGIPSAAEVQANGVELGEMNRKLLQKIEELTLYLIEMKKESERQHKEIEILKSNQNYK